MASLLTTTAEALKTAINAAPPGTYSQSFTAIRVAKPLHLAEQLDTLQVQVAPFAINIGDAINRGGARRKEIEIQVAVIKRISAEFDPTSASANATIDPLIQLVEEIAAYPAYGNEIVSGVTLLKASAPLPFEPGELEGRAIFLAVAQFTFLNFSR